MTSSATNGYIAPSMAPLIPRPFFGMSRKLNYALENTTNNTVPVSITFRVFFRFRRHGRIKQPISALNRQIAATSCVRKSHFRRTEYFTPAVGGVRHGGWPVHVSGHRPSLWPMAARECPTLDIRSGAV